MPMKVEAALITHKAAGAEFNTDSVNACGKTWQREAVHSDKGIRAVGEGANVPYYVLAASPAKGTAESAVDLFKSCTDIFAEDMSNCREVISEFYSSFAKVLNEAEFASDSCELSIFCGYGDTVFVSRSGKAGLFVCSEGELTELQPTMKDFSDGKSSFGVYTYEGAKQDDIFILLNGGSASVLPCDLLKAACASAAGDIRKLVAILCSQAEKKGCEGAVSAIVIKITETENIPMPALAAAAEAPDADSPAEDAEKTAAEDNKESDTEADTAGSDANGEEEENESAKPKGKVAFGIVIAIFLLLLIVLGYLGGRGIAHRHQADETTTEAAETQESTDAETTTQKAAEETTTKEAEETTAPEETEETTEEETSTRRQNEEVPATRPQSTTAAPTTEEPTEEATEAEQTSAEVVSDEVTDEPEEDPEEQASEEETPEDVTPEAPSDEEQPENGEAVG